MKMTIFTLSIFLLLYSCKNESLKTQTIETQKHNRFSLSHNYDKFKYHNCTNFEIDTLEWGQRGLFYNKIDTNTLSRIFNKGNDFSEGTSWYYYSTFKDTSIITLLEENDEYGPTVWLVKFDEKGDFKYKEQIALRGGDAGDAWHASSVFDNKNTFKIMHSNHTWDLEGDSLAYEDTTVLRLIITPDLAQKDVIYFKSYGKMD